MMLEKLPANAFEEISEGKRGRVKHLQGKNSCSDEGRAMRPVERGGGPQQGWAMRPVLCGGP